MEKSPNKYMQDKKIYKLSPNLIIENNNNNTFKYTSTKSISDRMENLPLTNRAYAFIPV